MQRCGATEVSMALSSNEDVSLILVLRDTTDKDVLSIMQLAKDKNIPIKEGSERDLWRMARDNKGPNKPQVLALVGRNPYDGIEETLSNGGIVWLLAGAKYPVNIGFTIRTAEVSGANAVFIDSEISNTERKGALRASMKAHRFIPIHWVNGESIVDKAKSNGFKIISIEDVGKKTPWEEDLTGNIMLIIGGERSGISDAILQKSDSILKIPMTGFVPSFNLQAPMAIVSAEAQRQRSA
ncbi:MAG: tRNA G18 (ribose-2'-O)-methylase SpoU [Candidatus Thalassarchaeaceae archaeon]|jgi:tRNA G18 (ribose-2'-O)-methylase SpoU|tara:strand:+ start:1306 stop:2022 length:717 start_codon:yes stop_codon:yes gene_type:complete